MGLNLHTCCHQCGTKVFHYRGEENKLMMPFYQKHSPCMRDDPKNVETLCDNSRQEAEWMSDSGGYEEDPLQEQLSPI